ncbi:serine protease [Citrobacter amalonaticus]|uniref:S1 family peptidase n=1 Tax=Citrobacter amalonaticus TaxID=35703 RepID=UPI001C7DCCD6|nr:serine protease [Citrobacter amalonaticus]QZA37038.1 serine protease [Citrobacter amalonaticus]HCD1277139.1 trypsin-like peptidase domain-containing protein [Citrobacter amalonaticus]
MFVQSDRIRDYVFPLCIVEDSPEGSSLQQFLGSGFLIGNNAFALTARHVLRGVEGRVCALFVVNSEWRAFDISNIEFHPEEDVAIFKVNHPDLRSIFCFNNEFENASREYMQFAYPDDMMYELEVDGRASGRPDMVFLKGYIRRRTNHPIPHIRGVQFFELSQIGGTGCSGSPIFKPNNGGPFKVMGVYVAERLNERGTSVSYAVREDAIRDWIPNVLGHSLLTEAGS